MQMLQDLFFGRVAAPEVIQGLVAVKEVSFALVLDELSGLLRPLVLQRTSLDLLQTLLRIPAGLLLTRIAFCCVALLLMGEVLLDFDVVVMVVEEVVHLAGVVLARGPDVRHLARLILPQTVVLLDVLVVRHQDFIFLVKRDAAVLEGVNDLLSAEVAHQEVETQVLRIVLLLDVLLVDGEVVEEGFDRAFGVLEDIVLLARLTRRKLIPLCGLVALAGPWLLHPVVRLAAQVLDKDVVLVAHVLLGVDHRQVCIVSGLISLVLNWPLVEQSFVCQVVAGEAFDVLDLGIAKEPEESLEV